MSLKISEMDPADALAGDEFVEVVQDGQNVQTTVQAIANKAPGGISGLTAGRIPFAAGASSLDDDADLVWNDSTKRMGVGAGTPNARLHVRGINNAVAFVVEDNDSQKIFELGESGGSRYIGFFGSSVAQITSGVASATPFVANSSGIADDTATWGGYKIGQIVKALRDYGLLA